MNRNAKIAWVGLYILSLIVMTTAETHLACGIVSRPNTHNYQHFPASLQASGNFGDRVYSKEERHICDELSRLLLVARQFESEALLDS